MKSTPIHLIVSRLKCLALPLQVQHLQAVIRLERPFSVRRNELESLLRGKMARQLPLAGFMKEYTRAEAYPGNFCRVEDAFESYMIFLENVNETKAKKDTTLTSFVKLLAVALDVSVEGGFIQGRGMCKKIVSVKKRQFEDRSYFSSSSSVASSSPPVDEFVFLDRAMTADIAGI